MENPSVMEEFILYNNWANQTLLAACQTLSAEQLAATAVGTYGNICDTLAHMISAEADYVGRVTGASPEPAFRWEDKPGVAEMSAYAVQVGHALLDMVQRVPPTQLVIEHWEEGQVRYLTMALFIQIINHGIEHRTNITTILAQQNLPTPEVDGWGYMWSHKDKFAAVVERYEPAKGK